MTSETLPDNFLLICLVWESNSELKGIKRSTNVLNNVSVDCSVQEIERVYE